VPIGRARWSQPCDGADLLLIGPIQGERRRILMKPGGREGIDFQGIKCNSPKQAVEIGGKQGIEDLPQPVIMERGACEARLEQGEHPTLLQTCPYFIEGVMAIKNRQE
jgi:hypothetical protein